MPGGRGPPAAEDHAGFEEAERGASSQLDCFGRFTVLVHQDGKANGFVLHEGGGELAVPRTDSNDLCPRRLDLFLMATQLRRGLPAEDSAEMAQEVQHHRLSCPVVTQTVRIAFMVFEGDVA